MSPRRRFSRDYKVRILEEADQCSQPGQLKQLLQREGIYPSYLTAWRKQRDEGALTTNAHGAAASTTPQYEYLIEENQRLRQANEDLLARLQRVEVDLQVSHKVFDVIIALIQASERDAPP